MRIDNYYFSKRQIVILLIILTGLAITVYLVLNRQIFKSKASTTSQRFEIIQNTSPQQPAVCEGETCTTKTLDIVIKPNLEGEPKDPTPAKYTLPKSNAKIDPSVGYYIPFRDASVKVANPEAVKNRILNSWPNAKIENFDTIVNKSIENSWNPAFMITLWMEESGAQGTSGYADAFGCEPTNPTTDINKSLSCVFNSFGYLTNDKFADFMCLYSDSGKVAPCNFGASVHFRDTIGSIYSELVPSGPGALIR